MKSNPLLTETMRALVTPLPVPQYVLDDMCERMLTTMLVPRVGMPHYGVLIEQALAHVQLPGFAFAYINLTGVVLTVDRASTYESVCADYLARVAAVQAALAEQFTPEMLAVLGTLTDGQPAAPPPRPAMPPEFDELLAKLRRREPPPTPAET